MGRLFSTLSLPGPDFIASLILETALSDAPKTFFTKTPLVGEILLPRSRRDEDALDSFFAEKTGLMGLRV